MHEALLWLHRESFLLMLPLKQTLFQITIHHEIFFLSANARLDAVIYRLIPHCAFDEKNQQCVPQPRVQYPVFFEGLPVSLSLKKASLYNAAQISVRWFHPLLEYPTRIKILRTSYFYFFLSNVI